MEPTTNKKTTGKRTLTGVVASDKMKDTVVVVVSDYAKHTKYHKYIRTEKRYKAHDAGNVHKIGETVTIQESAPISRDKHWRVI